MSLTEKVRGIPARVAYRQTRDGRQASRGEQLALSNQYRMLRHLSAPLPALQQTEFRNHSQNGEDGILLYLTTLLDITAGQAVEIGSGDSIECNTANLILNHGWSAVHLDGDPAATAKGRKFYAGQPETRRIPPTIVDAWMTTDNIGKLLAEHGATDPDLLSIDLDSIDLWITKAIQPTARIVVVEYNNRIPAEVSVTVPDSSEFRASDVDADYTHGEGYFGASLPAFVNALPDHRLVGANSPNTNAFFVRRDLLPDVLPAVSATSCLSSPWAQLQQSRWWEKLQRRNWVTV